jgi:uncharacterized protein (TIGR00645 family)
MENNKESTGIILARSIVFGSKWILIPFYLGLVIAQVLYAVKFVIATWELICNFMHLNETGMMMAILMLIDIVMIANLVRTIVSGSYHAFIDKNGPVTEHISSGYLKVKMGMSLVGISSIHLLQAFLDPSLSNRELVVKASLHVIFLVSTIGLALVEYLHEKTKDLKPEHQ